MVEAARRPSVSNPALQKRRVVTLERVTLRPGSPAAKARTVAATPKKSWRIAQGVAAAALIAAVPLAHASESDELVAAPPAIQIALAPEPLDNGDSVAAFPDFAKVEGIKDNPYDAMLKVARPAIAAATGHAPPVRARLVKKQTRVADAGPAKVSDLKANPYD